MSKFLIIVFVLFMTAACSTVRDINQKSSELASDVSMVESSANNIDRAIATGERLEERYHPRK